MKTDVLVIGGGMTGILCARLLTDAGVDCVVLEGNTVGSGVSGNSTAKITAQRGLFAAELIKKIGRDRAGRAAREWRAAAEQLAVMSSGVDCDFRWVDSCVYSRFDREILEREVEALEELGIYARLKEQLALPFRTVGGVVVPDQGTFHPLKFLGEISRGLAVRERTVVTGVEGHEVRTGRGTVTAEKIIVATHFPFLDRMGGYFARLYQERAYVLALADVPTVGGMYVDAQPGGLTFRDWGEVVIVAGGGHRTGKPTRGWRPLREFAGRYWPGGNEIAAWATQDCVTMDGLPYVGPYSGKEPHILVATGYQGWGMVGAMSAARILVEEVLGREHPCRDIFSPQRRMPIPKLAANGMEAALDMLTPLPRRCPHLGCALRYNAEEHTWDCPCHGSRFTREGSLIQGPAQRSLGNER
jgi:glycine/D-amino acid oxidase-like deaminating enzyme